MADARGARLVQVCESLCDRLRRDVGLTAFRIELRRTTTPLVIAMHSTEPVAYDPRHAWMRPSPPARLEVEVREADRVLARVEIEDHERAEYSESARAASERIAGEYASQLSSLLSAAES